GEDRTVPAHEAMQAAEFADHIEPRPQPQMERVAEDDLGTDLAKIARRHGFHRTIRANRHERGRFDQAARQRDAATACGTVAGEHVELQRTHSPCSIGNTSIASPYE